jgi:hypothetical protein
MQSERKEEEEKSERKEKKKKREREKKEKKRGGKEGKCFLAIHVPCFLLYHDLVCVQARVSSTV